MSGIAKRRYAPADDDPAVLLYAESMVLRHALENMVHVADPKSRYQRIKARLELVEEEVERLVPTSVLGEALRLLELMVALGNDRDGNYTSWAGSKLGRMIAQLPHREAKAIVFD